MANAFDIRHRGGGKRGIEATIAALATRQHGVVSRVQLLALGIGRRVIDRLLAAGWLLPLHRGVFAVGHLALTRESHWMAAVLACGDGAVLSHRSAAALLGLRRESPATIHVTAPRPRRRRRGIRCHSSRLAPDEITAHAGIPVTTPARTVLDLGPLLSPGHLARAIEQAAVLRLPCEVHPLVARYPGRPGTRNVEAALMLARPARVTRSELEDRFLALLADHGLPAPETNVRVEGFEVDCVWRDRRLVVELDGHAVHGTAAAFERDRARDRRLTLAGWRVVRVTWSQVGARLAADLRRLLA